LIVVPNPGIEVERANIEHLLAAKREQLIRQIARAFSRLVNLAKGILNLRGERLRTLHLQLGVAKDSGQ
jgi:hypothetical protein